MKWNKEKHSRFSQYYKLKKIRKQVFTLNASDYRQWMKTKHQLKTQQIHKRCRNRIIIMTLLEEDEEEK